MIGATIEEAQERMTWREYLTRLAWLNEDKSRPGKTEWYLMRIAQRVMQFAGWGRKEPGQIPLDAQYISLQEMHSSEPKPQPALSVEELRTVQSAQIKAAVLASVGGSKGVKIVSEHRAPLPEQRR